MVAVYDKAVLAAAALAARGNAYAPYSGFAVGAALLGTNGEIYTGCNVENAAYSVGVCAERVALGKAVSAGQRQFAALAVTGAPQGGQPPFDACPPCGMCRQALYEFGGETLPVLLVQSADTWQETTLGALLPGAFGPGNL